MYTGLSAFPLTPLRDDALDEASFIGLMERLADSGVDSITALGSTGSYAYLSHEERARVAALAVQHSGRKPVYVGVGALRTSQVLANIRAAEDAGASAVLLAPISYQPLTENDVLELFRTATSSCSLPVIVYDNPQTTHFRFTTELYARIAELPGIVSIKIPAVATEPVTPRSCVQDIRAVVCEDVTIGIARDPQAVEGINAGADTWYSVIAGTLPELAVRLARPAFAGQAAEALAASEHYAPLWTLYSEFGGSVRVVAALAAHLGLVPENSLPLPIQGPNARQKARVAEVAEKLDLASLL